MTPLFVCLMFVGQPPVVDNFFQDSASTLVKEEGAKKEDLEQKTAPVDEPKLESEVDSLRREPTVEELKKAKNLFRAGSSAYAEGRYDVAIDAFEAAHAIAPRPSLQFSLAQALRLAYFTTGALNLLERSIHYYRAYLDDKEVPRRSHASQHLATLLPILERLRIENVPGELRRTVARLIVTSQTDDVLIQVNGSDFLPAPASFEVVPGVVRLKLSAPHHHSVEQQVIIAKGSTVAVNVDLKPVPGQLKIPSHFLSDTYVDGVAVLGREIRLSPGEHRIRILGHGRKPYKEIFEIRSEQTTTLDAELPITFQTWGGFLLAVTGTGVAALAGVPLAFAAQNEFEAASIGANLEKRPLSVGEAERYVDLENQRDNWVKIAGVVALTGVSLFAFGGALVGLDFPASSGSQE